MLVYFGWKTKIANPEKSCTQGSFEVKGKPKGESQSMEVFYHNIKSGYIYILILHSGLGIGTGSGRRRIWRPEVR
jgi:hypothetical protein